MPSAQNSQRWPRGLMSWSGSGSKGVNPGVQILGECPDVLELPIEELVGPRLAHLENDVAAVAADVPDHFAGPPRRRRAAPADLAGVGAAAVESCSLQRGSVQLAVALVHGAHPPAPTGFAIPPFLRPNLYPVPPGRMFARRARPRNFWHVLVVICLTVVAAAAIAASATAAGPALSAQSRGSWYWSADIADAVFQPGSKLDAQTIIDGADCRGVGSSISSVRVDVDLYHRFRCTVHATSLRQKAQLDAAVTKAKAAVLAARGTPQHDELLNNLKELESKRAQYTAHGDSVTTAVTMTVTGRRSYSLS